MHNTTPTPRDTQENISADTVPEAVVPNSLPSSLQNSISANSGDSSFMKPRRTATHHPTQSTMLDYTATPTKRHVHAWEKYETHSQKPVSEQAELTKKKSALAQLHELCTSVTSGKRTEREGIETVIELTKRINKPFQETALARYLTETYYAICNALNRGRFSPREEDTAYRCIVYLTIDRNGTIIDVTAEKERASLATNEACAYITTTIQTMRQLRPLPKNYEHNTLVIPIPIGGRPALSAQSHMRPQEPITFYLTPA
jgi:hypothetical protein